MSNIVNAPKTIEDPCAIDLYYTRVQSNFLALHLQLAGEFETTYKDENGNERKVKRSPDGKFASKGGDSTSTTVDPTTDTLVKPEADEEIKAALLGESGKKIKADLIAGITQNPGIVEGINATKIDDVIKGTKDAFGNALDFINSQINKAAKAVSEHQEELAIGAAVVGAGVVGAIAGLAIATVTSVVISDSIVALIAGKPLSAAVQVALRKLAVGGVEELIKRRKFPLLISSGLSVMRIVKEVKKRLAEVKAASENSSEVAA